MYFLKNFMMLEIKRKIDVYSSISKLKHPTDLFDLWGVFIYSPIKRI